MNTYAYDIEIANNFFSIVFIPISIDINKIKLLLMENHSKCIKYILDKYKIIYYEYIINFKKNDLKKIVKFFNKEIYLIGFYNKKYDNFFLQYLEYNYNRLINDDVSKILHDLNTINHKLINLGLLWWEDKLLKNLYYMNRKWWSIDIYHTFFETIERKSLKQSAINLQWPRIQDLPFKNIVINVEETLNYNINDVLITIYFIKYIWDIIKLRFNLIKEYHLGNNNKWEIENILSGNKAKIGEILGTKMYSDITGLNSKQFKNDSTHRDMIYLLDAISDKIKFTSNELQSFLKRIKNTIIYSTKKELNFLVNYKGKFYQFGTGGLHSKDKPKLYEKTNEYLLLDFDFDSFYPKLGSTLKIEPAHLIPGIYPKMIETIINDRIKAKKINSKSAKALGLKIMLNAWIFGYLNYDNSWTKDSLAMVKFTLNGQLYLLMMIEQFEINKIEVISANTDGITCKVKPNQLKKYKEICNYFIDYTEISGEINEYILYVRKDIANYLAILTNNKIKMKGIFRNEIELEKGYGMPIRAIALVEYYKNNTPIEQTILNHKNIFNFCISQKMSNKFTPEYHTLHENKKELKIEKLQKNIRYYPSTVGGTLYKRSKEADNKGRYKLQSLLKGVKVTIFNDYILEKDFKNYNIDYNYFIVETKKIINLINNSPTMRDSRQFKKYKKAGKRKNIFHNDNYTIKF